jgi:hypothetical protein
MAKMSGSGFRADMANGCGAANEIDSVTRAD